MTFKEWRQWYGELPWTGKWFVILILLRPIIDNFYKIKEVSPFVSPLNIVGVLTPILVLISVASKKTPRKNKSAIANIFFVFSLIVLINWTFILILYFNVSSLRDGLKAITPQFLLLYFLCVMRDRRDLHGMLNAFLYSGIYLMCQLLYELIFGSISGVHLTEGRGGGERLVGFYNDMMNYAIYITGGFIIGGYYFLRNVYSKERSQGYVFRFGFILTMCVLGLIGIKHVSTWGVCLSLFTLLSFFNLKNFKGFFIILFIAVIVFAFFGPVIYEKQIAPLIDKEINAASGQYSIEGGLNGRIGRWEKYFDIWFDEVPWYGKLTGIGISGHPAGPLMSGAGMHNDYVRLLFSVGIIGVSLYVIFLFTLIYRGFYFRIPERFLIVGTTVAVMLHSITTVPLYYSSYMYLFMAVIGFALLPVKRAYQASVIRRKVKSGMRTISIQTPAINTERPVAGN